MGSDGEGLWWTVTWPLVWRRIKDVAIFGAGWYLILSDSIPLEPSTIAMVAALWGLIPISEAHYQLKKRQNGDES